MLKSVYPLLNNKYTILLAFDRFTCYKMCFVLQGVNSALTTFFFGPQMDQKLTIEKFLDFQQQLQREILGLEVSK